jgi:hypothetical protein
VSKARFTLSRFKPSPVLAGLLVVLLLVAEAFAAAHLLDRDAHAGKDPCKICLSIAPFGSAAPAHAAPLVVPTAEPLLPAEQPVAVVEVAPRSPVARGPPAVS